MPELQMKEAWFPRQSAGSKDHLIQASIVLGEPESKQAVWVLLKLIKYENQTHNATAANTQSNEAAREFILALFWLTLES